MKDPGKLPPANIRKIIHKFAPWILSQVANDIRNESLMYRLKFSWRMIDTSKVICFGRKFQFVTLRQQDMRWDVSDG